MHTFFIKFLGGHWTAWTEYSLTKLKKKSIGYKLVLAFWSIWFQSKKLALEVLKYFDFAFTSQHILLSQLFFNFLQDTQTNAYRIRKSFFNEKFTKTDLH